MWPSSFSEARDDWWVRRVSRPGRERAGERDRVRIARSRRWLTFGTFESTTALELSVCRRSSLGAGVLGETIETVRRSLMQKM